MSARGGHPIVLSRRSLQRSVFLFLLERFSPLLSRQSQQPSRSEIRLRKMQSPKVGGAGAPREDRRHQNNNIRREQPCCLPSRLQIAPCRAQYRHNGKTSRLSIDKHCRPCHTNHTRWVRMIPPGQYISTEWRCENRAIQSSRYDRQTLLWRHRVPHCPRDREAGPILRTQRIPILPRSESVSRPTTHTLRPDPD